jgi:hypothetical protein
MSHVENHFEEFLAESGLNKYYRDASDLTASLYHDCDIYGDVAESYIELLSGRYSVDVSDFKFHDYFPNEFAGNNQMKRLLFSFIPFLRAKYEDKGKYLPLTFQKIKEAINLGKLK